MLCVLFLIVTHFPCLFPFTATSQQEQLTVKSFCLSLSHSLSGTHSIYLCNLGYASLYMANAIGTEDDPELLISPNIRHFIGSVVSHVDLGLVSVSLSGGPGFICSTPPLEAEDSL